METAKLFMNGNSQAVRLPKEYKFNSNEVYIKKVGEAVMLYPLDKAWETFLNGLNEIPEDFFAEDREQGSNQKREQI